MKRLGARTGTWGMGFFIVLAGVVLLGCNPLKFKECRDEMTSSQQVLLDMDDQRLEDVEKSLKSVERALGACRGVIGESDVAKLDDAKTKLDKQLMGLRARAVVKPRPVLSEEQLARLQKQGDPGCPRGQEYEHPQNKQRVRCTGPQVMEMNWVTAIEQFNQRRGFAVQPQGSKLRFESGAEVVEFSFKEQNSKAPAQCVSVVGEPGISWQELVARATGVQPRVMKLDKPIPSARGPISLLVEGTPEQFVVKLGSCEPTPGQKPYSEPEGAK